ncbi:MAG: hypothetical protein ACRD08_01920 [Acidimicrobiales bacterium]
MNYSPTGAAATLVPLTQSGRWYAIRLDLDLGAGTLDAWVDGARVATGVAMAPGPITDLALWA